MAQTKAQLQAEIDMLRGGMLDLVDYLRRAAADKDKDFRDMEIPSFSRGMAGGAANGFSLAADWIMEELEIPR